MKKIISRTPHVSKSSPVPRRISRASRRSATGATRAMKTPTPISIRSPKIFRILIGNNRGLLHPFRLAPDDSRAFPCWRPTGRGGLWRKRSLPCRFFGRLDTGGCELSIAFVARSGLGSMETLYASIKSPPLNPIPMEDGERGTTWGSVMLHPRYLTPCRKAQTRVTGSPQTRQWSGKTP